MNLLISCEDGGGLVPAPFVGAVRSERPFALPAVQTPSVLSPDVSTSSQQPASEQPAFEDPSEAAPFLEATSAVSSTLVRDATAREIARRLADQTDARLIENPHSSQLIDVSRSLHHRKLFPALTRKWPDELRQQLIETVYRPYRKTIRSTIEAMLRRGEPLLHLSVRTFEMYHHNKPRRADMGLSYDPSSKPELEFCLDWIDWMYDDVPMLRVRRNYPRRGTHDSLTKSMRREFGGRGYLGIEVLLNRHWATREVALREEAIDGIGWSLQAATEPHCADAA